MLFRILCPPTGDGHGHTTDEPAQGEGRAVFHILFGAAKSKSR
jgi:hypothetical protein